MAKVTFTIHKAGKHQRHSRRNQILDAALRCFKKQGFHKTTLRDIAQEFGMSAGHIYNYFSNKEAAIKRIKQIIALDEVEDQAAAAAEAKLKAEAMACAYYPVSENPEA